MYNNVYNKNKYVIHVMICPGKPNVIFAIEIILLPGGSLILTSSINKAPAVITNQHNIKNIIEFKKPTCAVTTGKASIPPPIDVPMINKIPPISFELHIVELRP